MSEWMLHIAHTIDDQINGEVCVPEDMHVLGGGLSSRLMQGPELLAEER